MALKKGVMECKPALLEPIMAVTVTVPEQYMGDVNRDLNTRRGRVLGMDSGGNGTQVVSAHVPQAELFSYATELRSLTHGRGVFHAEVDHYEEVPAHVAEKVISAHRKETEGGAH
jgi:elongation factor G